MIEQSQHPILENLATSVLVLDSELRIEYVNPAAETLFEISAKKAYGRQWSDIATTSNGFIDLLQSSLDTTHPFSERELALTTAGNKTITVDCTVTPMLEPQYGKGLLIEI
ncbi:MAG: PAS domain-containing protein, partial [Gammaproteobacteria bacterium]|nr:PAS domain-containing protein [Gammaproteobacteria bacterium]